MSPKRKKLEAALDGLFSSRKSAPSEEAPQAGKVETLPASFPAAVEEPAVTSPEPELVAESGPVPESANVPVQLEQPVAPTAPAAAAPPAVVAVSTTAAAPAPGSAAQTAPPAGDQRPATAARTAQSTQQEERQLVVFSLAGVLYGLDIAAVESIIKMQPITVVPHARPWVEGVTNLRGNVLPVIDLRRRFDLPPGEDARDTRIMVIAAHAEKIGIIVDSVSEVLHAPMGSIEPPPPMITSVNSTYLTGVANLDGRMVILLDFEKIVA